MLQVSGFTAFREPVIVDFRGADLFALTGPTGSGKSSLIDAIVFSLYGSVPRIGQRDVAPIVSLGKLEARVHFEFSLDGIDYTVARVVRRTKSGASTAEARLERDGEVLAGTADEVTDAVGKLLGLGFDHFTKSVVLPQGQFAAFLHDRPADRQKLLRELLDLGVYERMRELAKQRKAAAETRVQVLQAQLEELAFATPESEQRAEGRLGRLEALRHEVEEAEPKLQALRDRIKALSEASVRARASITRLETVKTPDGIGELAASLAEARRAAQQADHEATVSRERLEKIQAARSTLPAGSEVERVIGLHQSLAAEQEARDGLAAALEGATREAMSSATTLETARAAVAAARRELQDASRTHAAHTLSTGLKVGEACPVCHQTIRELPTGTRPPVAMTDAEAALELAIKAEAAARQGEASAATQLATEEARLADLSARIDGLNIELAGSPGLDETLQTRADIARVEADLKEARATADQTAASTTEVRRMVDAIEAETSDARRVFDETRDRVASLEPPVPGRSDLAADWSQLAEWAAATVEKLADDASKSEMQVEDREKELDEQSGVLTARLQREGLEPGGRPIRDVVVAACTAATHDLDRIREAAQRAAKSRTAIAAGTEEAELARSLGRHLSATGFEAWLMEEALTTLVAGANLLLGDLAEGAYSLEVVKRDFRVVDHRNANEPRLVKTLSGGETFLVSLALALSLAEQLASMSVHGGGRLESVFLDEGFGTLDVDTLDTVAHVIQELGARGRTVGIVTHVRDLAEQVPVRFEVRRGAGTATVERVEL